MKKFITVILFVFSILASLRAETKVEMLSLNILKEAMGDDVSSSFEATPLPHLKIFDTKAPKKIVAYLFNSGDMELSVKGYRDKIDIYLLLSPDAKVISVILGDNKETRKSLDCILKDKFLEEWRGRTNENTPPDVISGATLTCNAINGSTRAILKKLSEINFFK
jgi:hypothetical protein